MRPATIPDLAASEEYECLSLTRTQASLKLTRISSKALDKECQDYSRDKFTHILVEGGVSGEGNI